MAAQFTVSVFKRKGVETKDQNLRNREIPAKTTELLYLNLSPKSLQVNNLAETVMTSPYVFWGFPLFILSAGSPSVAGVDDLMS